MEYKRGNEERVPRDVDAYLERLRQAFEEHLERNLPKEPRVVFDWLEEYIHRGGKRFRPLLLLAAAGEYPPSIQALDSAVVLELFHTFTLIHDDIEDGSRLRRGSPALHVIRGLPRAVHDGDALYTLVWDSLFTLSDQDQLRLPLSYARRAFREVMEGQAVELAWIAQQVFPEDEKAYERMTAQKTGALLGAALAMGRLLRETIPQHTRAQREAEAWYAAGRQLGVAFQILDDYLNLFGSVTRYGKTIGDDITEGKRTLLVIHALHVLSEADAARLRTILMKHTTDPAEIREAIRLIELSEAPAYALSRAKLLAGEVKRVLQDPLLHTLVDRAIQRDA